MRKKAETKIVSDEFIESFLNEMSSDVIPYRATQPEYKKYREEGSSWSGTVIKLGKPLYDEYEDGLGEVFGNFEEISETFFWVQGLKDAVNGQFKSRDEVQSQKDIPGLDEAEKRLDLACQHFIGQLGAEYQQECSDYLKLRKEMVAEGRHYYYCHGFEFADTLLKMAGLKYNTENDE